MVEYITRAEFRSFANEIGSQERASLRKRAEDRSPLGTTFLSHSSKDEELVDGAIRVLENHGAHVYMDKKDPSLPPYTSKDTADALKTRINQSKKFVLLASENSKESKWVPWELGLADGYKHLDNIALFPAVEASHQTQWTSWEYLGLYDRIVWGRFRGEEGSVWMVWNERQNTATRLSEWLKR